jgi:hypothetical protein
LAKEATSAKRNPGVEAGQGRFDAVAKQDGRRKVVAENDNAKLGHGF